MSPQYRHGPSSALFARKKAAKKKEVEGDMDPAKKAALDGVLQQIERNYGRGSIVKLGDAENMVVDCVGSGALTLGKLLHLTLEKGFLLMSTCTIRCCTWWRIS